MFGIGKNFEEKVKDAVAKLGPLGVKNAGASVNGKVVTLTGVAPDKAVKVRAMQVFNELVETENTINLLSIAAPAAGATPPVARNSGPTIGPNSGVPTGPHAPGSHEIGPAAPRVHVVAKGDTLSAIAKTYYGKASQYPKIFEANRDILKDPDEIFPGQRLRIP